ncbi:MAG: signal recognition particle-docking protein FtsY [Acidithiobacillus sp.]
MSAIIPSSCSGHTSMLNWFKGNKTPPPRETTAPAETVPAAFSVAEPAVVPPASATDGLPAGSSPAEPVKKGLFARLKEGLSRSREQLTSGVERLVLGKKEIDAELLDDLEALLLQADLGMAATREMMAAVTEKVRRKELADPQALTAALRAALLDILRPRAAQWSPRKGETQVVMMVGINGAGKTTTIGKLAARWKGEGFGVLLAAGDTFRAAAVEQLQAWGERVQVPVVAQGSGADSASVIYDAYAAARARGSEVLIADTAGRLHTQGHLMEELKKVKRVLAKLDPAAPQQIWLVLDAGTGQNALNQARQFHEAVGLTGICITKLDGTAKGGVVAAVAKALPIPIRYVGVGEGVEDLRPFDPQAFVDALFAEKTG